MPQMTSIVTSALVGALLLSSTGTTSIQTESWTKNAPIVPTYEYSTRSVSMTGYNAVPDQTDGNPDYNASGQRVNPEIDAAVSRDMLKEGLPFGTIIELVPGTATTTPNCGLPSVDEYVGYRVVTDTMNARYSDFVDILFGVNDSVTVGKRERNKAKALGLCRNVEIRIVGAVDMKNIPDTQKELKAFVAKQLLEFNTEVLAVAK